MTLFFRRFDPTLVSTNETCMELYGLFTPVSVADFAIQVGFYL